MGALPINHGNWFFLQRIARVLYLLPILVAGLGLRPLDYWDREFESR
jgi:hypothetical protein